MEPKPFIEMGTAAFIIFMIAVLSYIVFTIMKSSASISTKALTIMCLIFLPPIGVLMFSMLPQKKADSK